MAMRVACLSRSQTKDQFTIYDLRPKILIPQKESPQKAQEAQEHQITKPTQALILRELSSLIRPSRKAKRLDE
jgi:hypothetical protein